MKVRDDADRAEWIYTLLETNIDTKNDGFLNVPPFKDGSFGYPCSFSGVYSFQKDLGGGSVKLVGKVCVLVYVV